MSWVMTSGSGRRWVLGDVRSDGSPTTREDAERVAAQLGWSVESLEQETIVCGCGRPARGPVPAGTRAPAHTCRQCSEAHCELEAYYAAREGG